LMELAKRVKVSVTADSAYVIRGLSGAAQRAGLTMTVLIECDTGAHRCGVQSPQEAAELARLIGQRPNLHFGGLMTYPTSEQTDLFVRETRALIKDDGLQIERVSGGGTPTMWQMPQHPEITEH